MGNIEEGKNNKNTCVKKTKQLLYKNEYIFYNFFGGRGLVKWMPSADSVTKNQLPTFLKTLLAEVGNMKVVPLSCDR